MRRWAKLSVMCLALAGPAFVWADATDDLVQQIVRLLGNPDREFRAAGLEAVRNSAKGAAHTQTFAAQLPKLDTSSQAALITALGDRGDVAARPAVIEQLTNKDEEVRVSALAALSSFGDPSDVPTLIKALSSNSGTEQQEARGALIRMRSATVAKRIAAESKSAAPPVRGKLIEILAARRAAGELPTIIAATTDDDGGVRTAAMNALGQIGKPDQLAAMLPGVLKAARGGERDNAERNVTEVCKRIDNEDQRGTLIIEALKKVDPADRDELLPLVGRVGGRKLIDFVGDIASEQDPTRRKFGINALSNWPDASVADKLLEIANKTTDAAERNQAFQGYVKIAATRDNRNDKQRLERMMQAMKAARTPDERLLVINRTRTAYAVESVRFVLPYLEQPEFAQLTCETIVEIAHHREVRDPNKAEFDKVLDKVIATTKDPVVVDRAQRYKRGETWERPKK